MKTSSIRADKEIERRVTYGNVVQGSLEIQAAGLRVVVLVGLHVESRVLSDRRVVAPRR